MSRESGAGPERGGTHSGGMNKGGANTKGSSSSSGGTKGSQGSSAGTGTKGPTKSSEGWQGGASLNLGGGSYSPSTDFGKGDTGSAFGGNFGGGTGTKGTTGTSPGAHDAAFANFRPDTPQNTQFMGGQMYVRDQSGNWQNYKTGQGVSNTQLDRLAHFDTLRQNNMMSRGYDDLTAVKSWFKSLNPFADEERGAPAGISPLGGWASYGGAVPGTEDPRGFFQKLGDTLQKFGWGLQDSPLKTLADLASNPLVTTVGALTGTLPAIAAVRGASALKDAVTGVSTPAEAAQSLATTAITSTPVGNALGEFKGLASAAITADPSKIAGGLAGFTGGKVGTGLGSAIGSALTNNPYGAAIGSMIGGTFGSYGGQQLAAASSGQPQVKGPSKESAKDTRPSSPLVSKGDTQVAAAPSPEADPLKYIREMELPFYGPQYQVNPYGIPNTYMMGA